MFLELARRINMPEWATEDTRYWCLYMNDLWLSGSFYDNIQYSFAQETNNSRQHNKMWDKRPSIRLNLPAMAVDITSRKLFAESHAPHFVHDNDNLKDALKWLMKQTKLMRKMLDIAHYGQAGSVVATLKLIDSIPCINIWQARFCYPDFDEAERLSQLKIAYVVNGSTFLEHNPPMAVDCEGDEVIAENQYWYVRVIDKEWIQTCLPIKYSQWNPENGHPKYLRSTNELSQKHGAPDIPAIWMTNLSGGSGYDGRSTYCHILDNAIHLDYTLSQLGRGINYSASPQLMVKGKVLNLEPGQSHMMGPSHMLQLAPDRKNGDSAITGSDAKMLEISGQGIDVGMSKWVERIKQWTQEIMAVSRKDPNTISGAMSGKAMELIDEDFVDLVQVLKTSYGDDGLLEIVKMLARMCIAAKHPKFQGISESQLDDLELDWPKMYNSTAQEIQFLSAGLVGALQGGLMSQEESRAFLETQIDLRGQGFDAGNLPDINEMQPDPPPQTGTPAPKPKAKGKDK